MLNERDCLSKSFELLEVKKGKGKKRIKWESSDFSSRLRILLTNGSWYHASAHFLHWLIMGQELNRTHLTRQGRKCGHKWSQLWVSWSRRRGKDSSGTFSIKLLLITQTGVMAYRTLFTCLCYLLYSTGTWEDSQCLVLTVPEGLREHSLDFIY